VKKSVEETSGSIFSQILMIMNFSLSMNCSFMATSTRSAARLYSMIVKSNSSWLV